MDASETTERPRLWTQAGFRTDEWRRAAEEEALTGTEKVILPLETFLALDPAVRETALPRLGVEVLPGEAVEPLVPFLDRLPLVALAFPAFNDGRSYSKAQLLRTRHGYKGELRASGDVLIDQLPFMLRCGFSSFEVRNKTAIERLEAGRLGGIPLYYQPAAAAAPRTAKYAWRRAAG
ncbi:DUF934 domain-containing protein [Chelativorans intermedius]|uniref:DUF934 domain-containing protein n=1 Tax=Chelativorans intermedius TaxID=515947 RepID=A0ABV6DCF2_9HYPH|nr:DUF934 domain-containing protein [Chelativorans intermedius]MCT9000034.1 DUF934 domain-containing protein [Chelativorans intermedius]